MWSTHCVLLDVFCSPCIISEIGELCAKITIKTVAAPSDKWQHKNNSFNIGPWKKVQLCSPSSVYPLKKNIFLLSICLFVCLSAWASRSGVVGLCVFVHFFSLVSSLSQHKWLELTRSLLYLCRPSSYKNDFLSIHTVWIRSTWGTVLLLF